MRNKTAPISTSDVGKAHAAAGSTGRIGPNAAIQLIAAFRASGEPEALERLFAEAGRAEWLEAPPTAMIDQRDAARLHQGTRRVLDAAQAESTLAEAGRLTALYLLANRIPAFAQVLLRWLPPRLSAAALTRAIGANAWTFAGTGRFVARGGRDYEFRIDANPLVEGAQAPAPLCVWNAKVFETLFQTLVSKRTRVREVECAAAGGACCRFALVWRSGSDAS